jgi:hypothetical protein
VRKPYGPLSFARASGLSLSSSISTRRLEVLFRWCGLGFNPGAQDCYCGPLAGERLNHAMAGLGHAAPSNGATDLCPSMSFEPACRGAHPVAGAGAGQFMSARISLSVWLPVYPWS